MSQGERKASMCYIEVGAGEYPEQLNEVVLAPEESRRIRMNWIKYSFLLECYSTNLSIKVTVRLLKLD